MPRVNLLPWREERRRERQRRFLSILGLAVVGTLAVFALVTIQASRMIGYQRDRNTYLQSQISELDRRIKEIEKLEETKARLMARKEIIEQLQQNRSQMVHLFDELVRTIPDGVYLTSVKQSGNNLVLEGVAESAARVSTYMRNIEASDWLHDPWLEVIKAQERNQTRVHNFTLKMTLMSKERAGEEDLEGDNSVARAGPGTPGAGG